MDRYFLESLKHDILRPWWGFFNRLFSHDMTKALNEYARATRHWKANAPPKFRTAKEYKEQHNGKEKELTVQH